MKRKKRPCVGPPPGGVLMWASLSPPPNSSPSLAALAGPMCLLLFMCSLLHARQSCVVCCVFVRFSGPQRQGRKKQKKQGKLTVQAGQGPSPNCREPISLYIHTYVCIYGSVKRCEGRAADGTTDLPDQVGTGTTGPRVGPRGIIHRSGPRSRPA